MRFRLMIIAAAAFALLVAGCGGSSKSGSGTTPATTPGSTVHIAQTASNTPSVSAQMICQPEVKNEIRDSAMGVDTVQPLKSHWDVATHTFSCDYVYENGAVMTLSVKEMSSPEETDAYFDSLAQQLGKKQVLNGLAPGGAFSTPNGDVVAKKDYKVLLVDVSKLPAKFGIPANTPRGDDAVNVAATIMGCWTGA
jgi:hypothetical protein